MTGSLLLCLHPIIWRPLRWAIEFLSYIVEKLVQNLKARRSYRGRYSQSSYWRERVRRCLNKIEETGEDADGRRESYV